MIEDKDPLVFIKHILENIKDVEVFTRYISKEEFFENKEKQNAVIRSIEVIGEAAKNLPDSFKDKYPEISWKDITGTRDKLIHYYFGVDLNAVWKVVKKNIPELKLQIEEILKEESS